jgi:hypothetical protein
MKAVLNIRALAIAVLVILNLSIPRILSADCCKACGFGTELWNTSRSDGACGLYCAITQCEYMFSSTSTCDIGSYPCYDYYNDQCDDPIQCESLG